MLDYLKIYADMETWFSKLPTDAERGRLISAAFAYAFHDILPEFSADDLYVSLIWEAVKSHIDRLAREVENGKTGGRPATTSRKKSEKKAENSDAESEKRGFQSEKGGFPEKITPVSEDEKRGSLYSSSSHPHLNAENAQLNSSSAASQTRTREEPPAGGSEDAEARTKEEDAVEDPEDTAADDDSGVHTSGLPAVRPADRSEPVITENDIMALADQAHLIPTPAQKDKLRQYIARYPPEWVYHALHQAVEHGAKQLAYIRKCLEDFDRHGGPDTGKSYDEYGREMETPEQHEKAVAQEWRERMLKYGMAQEG